MFTLTTVLASFWLLATMAFFLVMFLAPLGYQDRSGFHRGQSGMDPKN